MRPFQSRFGNRDTPIRIPRQALKYTASELSQPGRFPKTFQVSTGKPQPRHFGAKTSRFQIKFGKTLRWQAFRQSPHFTDR